MQWNDLIGTLIGPYRILEEIGRGGSGRVYKASDETHDRLVAMKVIENDAEDAQGFVKRFGREVELVERLNHPNIVAVYDSGQIADLIYLVMRYINGGTLRQRLGSPLPVSVACAAMVQMCHALQHAHDAHIIHRDVKPSNMLVALDDEGRLLLTDFGIAKLQGLRGLTKSGMTIGTPEYMAPEQAEGREVDRRSDIYSLGCVLYEELSGHPPFVGTTPVSVLYQHVHIRPEHIRSLNPAVPRELAAVVTRALAKRPHDRFDTADAFALALMPFTRSGETSLAAVPLVRGAVAGAATRKSATPSGETHPPVLEMQPPGAPDDDRHAEDADTRDPADTHTGARSTGFDRDAPAATFRDGDGIWPDVDAPHRTLRAVAARSSSLSHRSARLATLAGGAIAALVAVAVLAWVLVSNASANIPKSGTTPRSTPPVPTITTTNSASTVTAGPQPTATLTSQQVLDQQAAASFSAVTLSTFTDGTCASANNRTSFSASQSIYVNLCLASNTTAGQVTVVLRQNGTTARVVTRNAPVDARSSTWYTFYTYNVAPGSYDVYVTFNGGTAADISITVH